MLLRTGEGDPTVVAFVWIGDFLSCVAAVGVINSTIFHLPFWPFRLSAFLLRCGCVVISPL
jgi:hypothetical protein